LKKLFSKKNSIFGGITMIQNGKIRLKGQYRFNISFQTMFVNINIETEVQNNMIVSSGEAATLNGLKDIIQGMGVGTSGTAPAKGNTTLTGEVRVAIDNKTVNTTEKTVTFKSTYTAAQINSKQEIGLFTHATAGQGTMITRSTFSSISIPAGSNMGVEYVLTLTA
jgi:hypothetical protein